MNVCHPSCVINGEPTAQLALWIRAITDQFFSTVGICSRFDRQLSNKSAICSLYAMLQLDVVTTDDSGSVPCVVFQFLYFYLLSGQRAVLCGWKVIL